jgi:hypothetical protein
LKKDLRNLSSKTQDQLEETQRGQKWITN